MTAESQASNGDRFKFTGREYDVESGMYYYKARYYDPSAGRFASQDPINTSCSQGNSYRYASNNVTNVTDATGLHTIRNCMEWFSIVNTTIDQWLDGCLSKATTYEDQAECLATAFEAYLRAYNDLQDCVATSVEMNVAITLLAVGLLAYEFWPVMVPKAGYAAVALVMGWAVFFDPDTVSAFGGPGDPANVRGESEGNGGSGASGKVDGPNIMVPVQGSIIDHLAPTIRESTPRSSM